MLIILQTNKFFHGSAPWQLVKSTNGGRKSFGNFALFLSAESIRIVAILLQPFMPEKMKAALDMMEIQESKRTFDDALFGADFTYGPTAAEAAGKGPAEVIFPMLLSSN